MFGLRKPKGVKMVYNEVTVFDNSNAAWLLSDELNPETRMILLQ